MKKTIDEIKSTQGVTGVYLFNPEDGVIDKDVSSDMEEESLVDIGHTSIKLYNSGRINFSDVTNLYFYYSEAIVIIRCISDAVFLIIFFDPSCNLNLLSMSINLVMEDLKNFADNFQAAVPIETFEIDDFEGDEPEEPAAQSPKISVNDLLNSQEMAVPLKSMETALAKLIGPMATIIFEDSLEAWIKNGNPTRADFRNLVEIINAEIKDPEKIAVYKASISSLGFGNK